MRYTHVVWDFNGTLLDDVQVGIDSQNAMLSRRGMRAIRDAEEYRHLFCFPVIDYYRKLGYDFRKESFDSLAHEWVGEYLARVDTAPLCQGAIELLELFRKKRIPQTILSATDKVMLDRQVSALGIRKYFDEVLGTDNIYAHGKTQLGKEWAVRSGAERILLIGDTDHDCTTAGEIGADCILVAQGHQCKELLRSCGVPVYEDITEFFRSPLAADIFR